MESILKDLRYGVRMLLKTPMFTLIAVMTLALGIGANTAIFSFINAILIKPLPIGNPQSLVIVGDPARGASGVSYGSPRIDMFSYPQFKAFRDATKNIYTDLYVGDRTTPAEIVTEDGIHQTPRAAAETVSGNFFEVLQVKPALGRTFTADDDSKIGGAPVIVLSYGAWKRRFNLDPGILGRTLKLNGYPFTVIGVMGPEFFGDMVGRRPEIWAPVSMQAQLMPGRKFLDDPKVSWLHMAGRLQPGVNMAQAQAASATAMAELAKAQWASVFQPQELDNYKQGLKVLPGGKGFSSTRAQFGTPLLILMGIVGLVLLVACVNIASLLLARASARKREFAVRLAIGASPGRVVRQLLTESLLLSLVGGIVGVAFASWATQAMVQMFYPGPEARIVTNPDWRVLSFTALICVLTGILFGLAPAVQSVRMELAAALKEGARTTGVASGSRWSMGRILVAAEVALCVLVLFPAALLIHSLQKLQDVDLGFTRSHIISAEVDPIPAGYTKPEQSIQIIQRLQQAMTNVPGVTSATGSENGLFAGTESADEVLIPGFTSSKNSDRIAYEDSVGPNYFTTLQTPLLLGRDFSDQDTASSQRVAVINESMMKFYFKGENPIGKTFALNDPQQKLKPFTIIGVARDVHDHDVKDKVDRRFYIAQLQGFEAKTIWHIEVRTLADPKAMTETLRKAIKDVDQNLQVVRVDTVSSLVDESLITERLVSQLSSFFGGLVLLLAAIGLYGIMAYTVAGRTREIGVRMALGAQRSDVLWMVLREALTLVAAGVIVGVPTAIAASTAMHSLLYGLASADPLSLVGTVLVLAFVAGLAGFLPARRATRIDPMQALRYE